MAFKDQGNRAPARPETASKEWFDGIDWTVLDLEKTDYVLKQANIRLEDSLANMDALLKKALILAGALAGYVAVLLPFVAKADEVIFIAPVLVMAFGLMAAAVLLVLALRTAECCGRGNTPRNMLEVTDLGGSFLNYLHCEIVTLETSIKMNTARNASIGGKINQAVVIVGCTIMVAIVVYVGASLAELPVC